MKPRSRTAPIKYRWDCRKVIGIVTQEGDEVSVTTAYKNKAQRRKRHIISYTDEGVGVIMDCPKGHTRFVSAETLRAALAAGDRTVLPSKPQR